MNNIFASISDINKVYDLMEGGYVPDALIRMGIRTLLQKRLDSYPTDFIAFQDMKKQYIQNLQKMEKIAICTDEANQQHYEVPPKFFELSLGENLKYSSCLFDQGAKSLEEAEGAMLDLYLQRAQVQDGMKILDLGCGWGSLSLHLARRFPNASITGMSNSNGQREYIMKKAASLGLSNVTILTRDMNVAEFDDPQFDRIMTIEMFEHMKGYEKLLEKVSRWLKPETGRLFIHVFCADMPYDFNAGEENSWMAKYFFAGGTMPSNDFWMWYQKDLKVVDRWFVNGKNYGETSEQWLKRTDLNKMEILSLFKTTYGAGQDEAEAEKTAFVWFQRWRMFYIACAESFNYNDGKSWYVSHYLLSRR